MQQVLWSFELFGFRVNVGLTFLFLAALVALWMPAGGALGTLAAIVVVFVSIVVHELGHAFTARGFGLQVGAIELHGIGGQVSHARTTNGRQLAISLAGPAAGLALGLIVLGLTRAMPPQGAILREIVSFALFVNIGWSLFNLLPVLPLDGGNALRSGLGLVMSDRNAIRVAAMSTIVLATVGVLLSVRAGSVLLGFMAAFAAYQGFVTYRQVA